MAVLEASTVPNQRYASAAAVVVALFVANGVVATGGDAGSGKDAGSQWWSALSIPYGVYTGSLASNSDRDWYRVVDQSSTPVCVEASLTPDFAVQSTLYVTGPSGTRTVSLTTLADSTQRAGVVVPDLWASHLGVSGPVTPYDFSMGATDLVPTSGEGPAGSDAGSMLATAIPTDRPCMSGHLTSIVDELDLFALDASAGETIYYSTGAASTGLVSVSLLDGAGLPVGYTIDAGQMAGYYVEEPGTFYLSASRSGTTDTVDYLLGVIVGPDPPTQGCRPTCMVTS